MHGLCESSQADKARALLSKVVSLNVVHFNMLMDGYVASGRLDEAWDFLWNIMSKVGCKSDIFTYNVLIHGLCKGGYLGSTLELVNEMIDMGYNPNVFTYTILINGYCKEGQLEEDGSILNEMSYKGISLNTVGYNSLTSTLCKNRKVNEMEEPLTVYHDMLVEGVVANTVTYNTLIHAFLWTGAIQEALKQAC
ncbi:hypothetical protein SLEP1_g25925 [Rubroshorea leprosula]|uniref:Pentatricopeptide repeat-containing protein n=1 Tax=Rubroshorea leprosula TaxID=152421 RepID=A0AAV5JV18_9ROSI|nr:hypothetical protein SLEP1_g25925 [Rubroshorea leprosula]